jgi:hypothetical protein
MAAAVMSMSQLHGIPSATPPLMATREPTFPEKLFKVKNVDDKGRIIHIGYLEITVSSITFQYEHYPSEKLQWPLSCIRKYGSNNKGTLFIIEAGRRAPQGEGMYAFRTKEADEMRKRIDHYARKF